jgi:hypothetical protein
MPYKPCIRCGRPFRSKTRQDRCEECRVAYRGDPEQIEMRAAINMVKAAIKRGELKRPEVCQGYQGCWRSDIHAHHEDYSKPLEVVWLCAWCHKQRHRAAPACSYTTIPSKRDWLIP